jgi:hypothetical protein
MVAPLAGHAPSGAIFTTLSDGSEVNFNIYPSKESVYLDGGPGPGAPQTAAGLDDGTYVFQVTDPSGKTLLSTDAAQCRQFVVLNGIITSVAPSGACAHQTGMDVDHGVVTVQLMPYDDTPNPGGVYKVWVTLVEDYGCALEPPQVDCAVGKHGFIPSHTKTDNFKVEAGPVREIDARFFNDANRNGWRDDGEEFMDGLQVTWTDSLEASNKKSSYFAPNLNVFHEAHVEAVEDGTHQITIDNQPNCTVGSVYADGEFVGAGPQTVSVVVSKRDKEITIFVDVACEP